MYLHNLHIRNIGPIEKIDIDFELNLDGNPKPIILIGKNGSGKTYALSYIADTFYEIAKLAFDNVFEGQSFGNSPYFRVISGNDVSNLSHEGGGCYLRFKQSEIEIHKGEKIGNFNFHSLSNLYGNKLPLDAGGNSKKISINKEQATDIYNKNVICYFPSFRNELPHWINTGDVAIEEYDLKVQFSGQINREIMIIESYHKNMQWLMNVYLDSALLLDEYNRVGITKEEREVYLSNKQALTNAKINIENIMKVIFENENIRILLGFRNNNNSRLTIRSNDGKINIPSLKQLSTGQSLLLNMFLTIVRHADSIDVNKSILYERIEGVVIVDEIDAHLHTKYQKEILPKLIKLFPKIQFILTSHSPLFILGMEDEFGKDGIQLIDMPSGLNINSDRFDEFEQSFLYYSETKKFEELLHRKVIELEQPLILVEGKTDIDYLKKSFELHNKNEWINNIQIEEIGITGEDGQVRFGGETNLTKGFDFLKHNIRSFNRRVLFLYDCDTSIADSQQEHIYRKRIPKNENNLKVKKGIENLLPQELFTNEFYDEKKFIDDYGAEQFRKSFNKIKFCEYICNSRGNKQDFIEIEKAIFPLIESFLK